MIMERMNDFKHKNKKIIDTVEYNGKYTDIATIRTRIIAASAVILCATVVIVAQIFWI